MFATSHLFFFGDLNFRLALPSSHALAAPDQLANLAEALSHDDGRVSLKEYDQLVNERDVKGTIFHGFREGEFWRFKCSYKYRLGEVDHYECVHAFQCLGTNSSSPLDSSKRTPSWTDRIMYSTHSDSPDAPQDSGLTNVLYTAIPSYTTSDHVCRPSSHSSLLSLMFPQKPVVSLLLLPPPVKTTTTVPVLRLPEGYHPTPDPWTLLKKYSGRALGRVIGYTWWLLYLLGAGSALFGLGNLLLSLGAWRWWRAAQTGDQEVLLP